MDAEIHYELARNQVYGELSRTLEGLRQNSHGLLAQVRKSLPYEFANDANFYGQVIKAHNFLAPLQEFCAARCAGQDYYAARRDLMDKFEPFADAGFSDEAYAFYQPSRMAAIHHATDEEKDRAYRSDHFEEFETTLGALNSFLHQGCGKEWEWATVPIIARMTDQIKLLKDPATADCEVPAIPAPLELQYFNYAVKWLQEREALAAVRANVHIDVDTTGLPGVFGKVSGNTPPEKNHYAHYARHCKAVADRLADFVVTGEYLKLLRNACALPMNVRGDNWGPHSLPVAVNLREALAAFSSGYMAHVIDKPSGELDPLQENAALMAAVDVTTDLTDEFINDPKRQPAPVHKPWKWQDLKI